MMPPDLLAHSARRPGATPQRYEEHIGNVRKGARARAEAMLQFALPGLDGLADLVLNREIGVTLGEAVGNN